MLYIFVFWTKSIPASIMGSGLSGIKKGDPHIFESHALRSQVQTYHFTSLILDAPEDLRRFASLYLEGVMPAVFLNTLAK